MSMTSLQNLSEDALRTAIVLLSDDEARALASTSSGLLSMVNNVRPGLASAAPEAVAWWPRLP